MNSYARVTAGSGGRPLSQASDGAIRRFAHTAAGVVEQVKDVFVVKLQELRRDLKFRWGEAGLAGLVLTLGNAIKQLPDSSRHNADILLVDGRHLEAGAHGVGFATSRLPVGQNCCVVAARKLKKNYNIWIFKGRDT